MAYYNQLAQVRYNDGDVLALLHCDGVLKEAPDQLMYVVTYLKKRAIREITPMHRDAKTVRVHHDPLSTEPFLQFSRAMAAFEIRSHRIDRGLLPSGLIN